MSNPSQRCRVAAAVVLALATVSGCGVEPPDGVVRLAPGGEIDATDPIVASASYPAVRGAAYRLNLAGSFADSQRAYQDALRLVEDGSPDDRDANADVRLHVALQLSNLEQYADAELMFDQARRVVDISGDPVFRPKYHLFYAQHLLAWKGSTAPGIEAEIDNALASVAAARATAEARSQRLAPEIATQAPVRLTGGGYALTEEQAAALNAAAAGAGGRSGGGVVVTDADRLAVLEAQAYYLRARLAWLRFDDDAGEWLRAADGALGDLGPARASWLLGLVQLQEAELRREGGDLAGAAAVLRSGIAAQRTNVANSLNEMRMLLLLGEIQHDRGRLNAALASYREALAIEREQGYGLPIERLDSLTETLLAPGAGDNALGLLFEALQGFTGEQTQRAVALLAARLRAGSGPEAALLREVQDLQRRRNELEATLNRLQASPNALRGDVRIVRDQLDAVEAQLAEQRAAVERVVPGYAQLVSGRPTSIAGLQEVMEAGEVFVQIQPGNDVAVVFVVTREAPHAYVVNLGMAAAGRAAEQLREPFETPGPISARPFDVAAAQSLFDTLFGPIGATILNAEHLIVAPSDALMNLPLSLLVTRPTAPIVDGDYSSVPFLAHLVPSTTVVSATSFVHARGFGPSTAGEAYIGFGGWLPPSDGAQAWERVLEASRAGDEIACSDTREGGRYLGLFGPLPGTTREVRDVAQVFAGAGSEVILGASFTDAAVREAALQNYRIVHFATHGALARERNCLPEPALITSLPDPARGDGILSASEIVGLELDAELVLLSACETGLPGEEATSLAGLDGDVAGGESLGALVRAFIYAGGRNVVVSHWQVPDVETAEVITRFLRAAQASDMSLARALQRAQIALADTAASSHPEFWAAFTIVGDGGRKLDAPMLSEARLTLAP